MGRLDAIKHSLLDEIFLNISDYEYMKNVLTIMDVNHTVFKKNMTLMHLCIYSDNVDVVKMVLDNGGDPNCEDVNGITPTDLCQILVKPVVYLQLMSSRGGKIKII